jgi:FtsP/CotA-like multicopper oxidase with cupredoxin domain
VLEKDALIEVVLVSNHAFEHPFHLHGHSFAVVGLGYGAWGQKVSSMIRQTMLRNNITY